MSIPTEREPIGLAKHDDSPEERCCFCRARTFYWTLENSKVTSNSVACCTNCSRRAYHEDLPSKAEWCRRESIADHSLGARDVPPPKKSNPYVSTQTLDSVIAEILLPYHKNHVQCPHGGCRSCIDKQEKEPGKCHCELWRLLGPAMHRPDCLEFFPGGLRRHP